MVYIYIDTILTLIVYALFTHLFVKRMKEPDVCKCLLCKKGGGIEGSARRF